MVTSLRTFHLFLFPRCSRGSEGGGRGCVVKEGLYLVPFRAGFDPEEPYPGAEKNDKNQQLTDPTQQSN